MFECWFKMLAGHVAQRTQLEICVCARTVHTEHRINSIRNATKHFFSDKSYTNCFLKFISDAIQNSIR